MKAKPRLPKRGLAAHGSPMSMAGCRQAALTIRTGRLGFAKSKPRRGAGGVLLLSICCDPPGRSLLKTKKVLLEFLGGDMDVCCRMPDKRVGVDFADGLYWVLAPW